MALAIATTSFECTIDAGLAHIVLNQPDRGNPIDGDFCREQKSAPIAHRHARSIPPCKD